MYPTNSTISSTKSERFENHRLYTESLLQSFYKLKQTTRDHVDLVYDLTLGRQAPPTLDSYQGIVKALRCIGAGSSSIQPKDLLIEWTHETNKSVLDSIQEFDPVKLECQAARSRWGFNELKVITAKLTQKYQEDRLVRHGKVMMQVFTASPSSWKRISCDTTSLRNPVIISHAWERALTFNSYVRLVQSLLLLGIRAGRLGLLKWLRRRHRLQRSQMLEHPWELAHLKLLVARYIFMGKHKRAPGTQRAAEGQQGGHRRDADAADEVDEDDDEDEGEEEEEADEEEWDEEVVRDDFTGRHSDPIALRLAQGVMEARETAFKANNDVAKAYDAVAWRSAELVAHLTKQGNHAGCPTVILGRHLEAPRTSIEKDLTDVRSHDQKRRFAAGYSAATLISPGSVRRET